MEEDVAVVTGASSGIGEAIARHLLACGRIVNISSRAILGKTHRTVYSAGKAALVGITRTLCLELGGAGRFNVCAMQHR